MSVLDGNLWSFLKEINANRSAVRALMGAGLAPDNIYWVDPVNGNNARGGKSKDDAFQTITYALTLMGTNDLLFCLPGQYDESPTLSRGTHDKCTLIGLGGRGSVYIEPSTEDASGLTVHADDVTIVNIGCAAEDTTAGNYALIVSGDRFRAYGCKLEGGEDQFRVGPGTIAQEAAGTHGTGADWLLDDCELCWGTNGINLVFTDYGAVTQGVVKGCRFHNLVTKHIKETAGSGGSAAVAFQNIQIWGNFFDDLDDGTAPGTGYIVLNGDNANTGVVANNIFPTAINSGKNLVSTAMHWVGNFHTGGLSTGQPS